MSIFQNPNYLNLARQFMAMPGREGSPFLNRFPNMVGYSRTPMGQGLLRQVMARGLIDRMRRRRMEPWAGRPGMPGRGEMPERRLPEPGRIGIPRPPRPEWPGREEPPFMPTRPEWPGRIGIPRPPRPRPEAPEGRLPERPEWPGRIGIPRPVPREEPQPSPTPWLIPEIPIPGGPRQGQLLGEFLGRPTLSNAGRNRRRI